MNDRVKTGDGIRRDCFGRIPGNALFVLRYALRATAAESRDLRSGSFQSRKQGGTNRSGRSADQNASPAQLNHSAITLADVAAMRVLQEKRNGQID
jgi:hypothetical protein